LDSSSEQSSSDFQHSFLGQYWDVLGGLLFGILAILGHKLALADFTTIVSAIAISCFSVTVAEIAEILASRLQEPYGSFVLTFSAVIVEIILLYMIILESTYAPEALDTVKGGIISAVLVDMNVLLGLAVFVGGLSFKEQEHNEDTSASYTTILLVTTAILLVPSILATTNHNHEDIMKASYMIGVLLFVFYFIILIFQTKTHIHFFKATARSRMFRIKCKRNGDEEGEELIEDSYIFERFSTSQNFIALFVAILFIGILAEIFASDGIRVLTGYGISPGIAGIVIAIVAVAPELFTAVKAAKNDQIQRVVNIAMGASTVSILITVPVLLVLSWNAGIDLALDFNPLQIGALLLTILLAWKTTEDGETNYLEGTAHLVFFMAYAIIAGFY